MDNIIEPNSSFDFSKISLVDPVSIQGGSYFTRLNFQGTPLYFQTPKCVTRQGFIKNGKRFSCDLMFDNTAEEFITWIENLENNCQKLLQVNSSRWFETPLTMNDVESAFTSPLKVYKSGKFYLLRSNVKTHPVTNVPLIKIFNENETTQTMEEVKEETNIISIVEIQGIKFTTRSFQMEFEIKQVMTLNTEVLFENCLIKKRDRKPLERVQFEPRVLEENNREKREEEEEEGEEDDDELIEEKEEIKEDIKEDVEVKNEPNELDKKEQKEEKDLKGLDIQIETTEMEKLVPENDNDLKEIELQFDSVDALDTLNLKKPNELYYTIYKEARRKAKEAKKTAVLAYLEAKKIKKTYMLEELDNSDSESVEEDEFSLE